MHFICVHGVGHGGWCWDRTAQDLRALGHTVATPDLPLTSLEDDAQTIVDALDDFEGPKVLIGHSYGGLVISKAADQRTDIERLFFVAAIMIEPDENFMDVSAPYPTKLNEALALHDDGTFTVVSEKAREIFYHKCPDDVATAGIARLRATSFGCLTVAAGVAAWRDIASTYIICRDDHAVSPQVQEIMARRAQHVVELDTDHSPFLSKPKEFLDIVTHALANV